jgi:hypothetical protein
MPINVTAVPTLSDHVNDVRLRTAAIVNESILPREAELWPRGRAAASEEARRRAHEARDKVRAEVRAAGLWAPHLTAPRSRSAGGCSRSSRGRWSPGSR